MRPHHLLDIVAGLGHGVRYTPHPYGHSQHLVVERLLADPAQSITFVCAADDICAGCCHLHADGSCDDVLAQLTPPPSKQAYNDALDARLFPLLGLRPGDTLPLPEYLERVAALLPGLEQVCAHPGEDPSARLAGLQAGIDILSRIQ